MFNLVLFEPEIPPNTGNLIRLCANTGCRLHLIEPLGFNIDDKQLRRAGLDYHQWAQVRLYPDFTGFMEQLGNHRLFAFTTKAQQRYSDIQFQASDYLLFGPETRGLPDGILEALNPDQKLRIPMLETSRSLNLSNAVSIVAYEAWRQAGFTGAV